MSNVFDRQVTDVFAVQDEITMSTVDMMPRATKAIDRALPSANIKRGRA
ncbi:MAG: hypothetical protein H0U59_06475 [Gemmatimonadaceae bacterium]|nr:hypothetical protein [Gemmatimonadaceae bacterium]